MKTKYILTKTIAVLSSAALLAPFAQVGALTNNVGIYGNYFSQQTITVQAGDTIVWANYDSKNHTVTSDTGYFNSGTLAPGSSYSIMLSVPGTYPYYCSFHGGPGGSGMSGIIIVTSGGSGNSATSTISGTVQASPPIVVNQITPVQTTASADGTYTNGWKWVFDISAPASETNLMMKFSNWLNNSNSSLIIPVSNNMRFYSSQSSNAYSEATAVTITTPNTYSSAMYLTGDLDPSPNIRRVQITVQVKIPVGTSSGSYTSTYGIKTQ